MEKRSILFLAILLSSSLLFLSCTSAKGIEVQQKSSVEQEHFIGTISEPKRMVKESVLPYGDSIMVTNKSGYTLMKLDIFNANMFVDSNEFVNLLGDTPLENNRTREIFLDQFPTLKESLFAKKGELFALNAIDFSFDRFLLWWDPLHEQWNITITMDHYFPLEEFFSLHLQPNHMLVKNETGFPIAELFLEIDEDEQIDLLEGRVLESGNEIDIDTEKFPLPFRFGDTEEFLIRALDLEGDSLYVWWKPSEESWEIRISYNDYHFEYAEQEELGELQEGFVRIYNRSSVDFWYLYLATESMYNWGNYGEDVLDSAILYSQYGADFSPLALDYIVSFFETLSLEELYLIALDYDLQEYVFKWNPFFESWEITLIDDGDGNVIIERGQTSAPF